MREQDGRDHEERSGTERRSDLERRLSEVPVYLDRRHGGERRNGMRDRRSDVFERLYLERMAEIQAHRALVEQQLAEGA